MTDIIVRAAPASASWDAKTRTFRAILTTGADVDRGSYIERLDLSAVNPADLIGKPVLDTHRTDSATDAIGKIIAAAHTAAGIEATIQLSDVPRAAEIGIRIADGVVKAMSIGFRVSEWTSAPPLGGKPVRVASKWQITEASVVINPADPSAIIRSKTMHESTPAIPPAITVLTPPDMIQTRAAIRDIARRENLPPEWADRHIDSGSSLEQVRADAYVATRERQTPVIRVMNPGPSPEQQRQVVEDAMFAQMTGTEPTTAARPLMTRPLSDIMRDRVEAAGTPCRGMSPDDLHRAAMTSSDFPIITQGAGQRVLTAAYTAAQSPVASLARKVTMPDFRPGSRIKISDTGPLQPLSESGEMQRTTMAESEETFSLVTYAAIAALSRQVRVNDTVGAFGDMVAKCGRAAAETEANLLVNKLVSNPKLSEDGKKLFDASRNAATTGSVLSVESLGAARRAMRNYKGLDGKTPINANPAFLLVSPDLETEAEQLLTSIYAATVGAVNPFTTKLSLMVEPRLSGSAWYVFSNPANVACLERAYLAGAPGPQIARKDGWDVLATEWRVYLDIGCGAVDWRGGYFNPGAAS